MHTLEQTLIIVKPKSVKAGHTGEILLAIEKSGFIPVRIESFVWHLAQVQEFYLEHASKPFYKDMCEFMSGKMSIVIVLEKVNAIDDLRTLIGHTDPQKAHEDSIRGKFGSDIDDNVVHASDSKESFQREYEIIFNKHSKYHHSH